MPVNSLKDFHKIPNLARVAYASRGGLCFETRDIELGHIEIQHVNNNDIDVYVGKVIVYNSAMDVVYFENNNLDVSHFMVENLHNKVTLCIRYFDMKGKRISTETAPYHLTRAMPTAYTVYSGDKSDWTKTPLSGWLVTWSASLSYLPRSSNQE